MSWHPLPATACMDDSCPGTHCLLLPAWMTHVLAPTTTSSATTARWRGAGSNLLLCVLPQHATAHHSTPHQCPPPQAALGGGRPPCLLLMPACYSVPAAHACLLLCACYSVPTGGGQPSREDGRGHVVHGLEWVLLSLAGSSPEACYLLT